MSAAGLLVRAAGRDDIPAVLALWAAGRSGHASLIAASDGWRGNMYRLTVDPARRRRGLARALVREGERRLRESGTARITALVAHDDTAARDFWTSVGYGDDRAIGRFVRNA